MDEKHICSSPGCDAAGKLVSQGVVPSKNKVYRFYACEEHRLRLAAHTECNIPIIDYISDDALLNPIETHQCWSCGTENSVFWCWKCGKYFGTGG